MSVSREPYCCLHAWELLQMVLMIIVLLFLLLFLSFFFFILKFLYSVILSFQVVIKCGKEGQITADDLAVNLVQSILEVLELMPRK